MPEEISFTPSFTRLITKFSQTTLFNNKLGENTRINPPIFTILADKIRIGKNVIIMNGFQCMSAWGGLTIEDNTMISLNCTIATNMSEQILR